jgi:hypothetical protein
MIAISLESVSNGPYAEFLFKKWLFHSLKASTFSFTLSRIVLLTNQLFGCHWFIQITSDIDDRVDLHRHYNFNNKRLTLWAMHITIPR